MNEKDRLEVMALMELRSIPEPNSGCWLWTASSDQDGYGKTRWHGVQVRAHRLSFEAFTGIDPGPLFVCHSCDVSCCVNPSHLRADSGSANSAESSLKGRMGRGRKSWSVARGASTTHRSVFVGSAKLTYDLLSQWIAYNAETGEFRWLERANDIGWTRKNAGRVAGWISPHGKPDKVVNYVRIGVAGSQYYAHRLAWLWMHGVLPEKGEIDHINGDTLDNRIANLRVASHAQNGHNQGLRRNNTSGVKGVSWDAERSRWFASITVNGKSKGLGRYEEFDDAVAARKKAEAEYHGAFAHIQGTA